ncbi:MAG: hypothetical protein U9O20_01225 [Patescibacteria group bacterium]|nr:hypothetical protein [Patescibacteria group bacterium]
MDQQTKVSSRQASPYFASVNFEQEKDTKEERTELTRKFISLPRAIRYGLLDSETRKGIERVSNSFGVNDQNKIGEISRMVRNVYLEKIDKSEIKKGAQEKIAIESARLDEFVKEVDRIAKKVKQRGEEEIAADSEELPIIPALKKFEKLGGQEITEGFIEIEVDLEKKSVEPTIRNWLEDYIQNKGAQAHDNLERSDYLYKSANTELLSTQERDKLSFVLRSYDLDETILVSKGSQEVFFEKVSHVEKNGQVEKRKESSTKAIDQKKGDEKNFEGVSRDLKQGDEESKGRQQESFERMIGEEDPDDERIRNKPHEITWYGKSSPFDNLEKIDTDSFQKGSQEKLENKTTITAQKENEKKIDFALSNNPQKMKHVVDLKKDI